MLGILSVLNWLMAALYASGIAFLWIVAGDQLPADTLMLISAGILLLAAPFAYLGYAVEKGRGRTLQTVFAVLALFNVPLGTAFGIFALWVCWSAERDVFEQGGLPQPDDDSPRARDHHDATPVNRHAVQRRPVEDDGTPYSMAKSMRERGASAQVIQSKLESQGLDREEVETVMNALGLRRSRARPS